MKDIQISLLGRGLNSELIDKVLIEQQSAVRYRDAYLITFTQGEACFLIPVQISLGNLICWIHLSFSGHTLNWKAL